MVSCTAFKTRWPELLQRGWLAGSLLVLLMAGGVSVLMLAASMIEQNIERVQVAQTDNTAWLISQIEVDVLKFHHVTHRALLSPFGPESLADVRRLYDIMFSRSETIGARMANANWYDAEELQRDWRLLEAQIRAMALVVDQSDPALRAALPELSIAIEQQAEAVRHFSVTALMQLVKDAANRRENLRDLLRGFSFLAVVLISLLLVVTGGTIMLLRRLQLRASQNERMKANIEKAIEASLDAVLVADDEGRIVAYNSAAESIFGFARNEAIGSNLSALVIPERLHRASSGELAGFTMEPEGPIVDRGRLVLVAQRKDGQEFPVEATIVSDRDVRGKPIYFAFFRDISERIRIEGNLKRTRDEALRSKEAKSRFLAVMSHEMRTPLNGLIAAIDIVTETTRVSAKQAHFLCIARSCSLSALEQINDVLELARLDNGELSEDCVEFDPIGLILEITEQSRPMAEQRDNSLQLALPAAGVPRILGYRRLFAQVLFNLLANAIKFTDRGMITISAQNGMDSQGRPILRVEVEDTGIGIPEQKHSRIFEDFETLDGSYSRVRQGTGLGLGIARRAVAHMGGEIGVQSRLGVGSTFWFTVPLIMSGAQAARGQIIPHSTRSARLGVAEGCQVLIAEDNAINREVLREMLEHCGHTVTEAMDGAEALAFASATRFDLVLMDISMPMMDGIEASGRIRSGGASATTPIIGLTAHAFPEEIARFRTCGMEEVIVKPITLGKLQDVLSRHCSPENKQAGAKPTPPEEPPLIDNLVFAELCSLLETAQHWLALTQFDGELAGLVEDLRTNRLDDIEIGIAAHRIGGAAAVLGAARARAMLENLEHDPAADRTTLALALDQCRAATVSQMRATLEPAAA